MNLLRCNKAAIIITIFIILIITITIKLHADGNITSKLIEQYSAAGCYNIVLEMNVIPSEA
jgi:hypothetical protein